MRNVLGAVADDELMLLSSVAGQPSDSRCEEGLVGFRPKGPGVAAVNVFGVFCRLVCRPELLTANLLVQISSTRLRANLCVACNSW